jgi:PAS domain S-box-containing protein
MDSERVKHTLHEVESSEPVVPANGAGAEEALRASEEKYRTLFEAIEQGLVIGEVILNDSGEGVDYRVLEANSKFERLTGLSREELLGGRTARSLIPTLEESWLGSLGLVAVSGQSIRFETYAVALDRWFEVYAFRIGDAKHRRVAALYNDITSRRRAELALRNSERVQKYLLKLSDVLRPLADPIEIMRAGPDVLAHELDVSAAGYVELAEDGQSALIGGQYADGRMPQFIGACRLSDFGDGFAPSLALGDEIFASDIYEDPRGPAGGSEKSRSFGIRSAAGIPLIKDGRLVAMFYAVHSETRPWPEWEREIVRQTAERTWAAVQRARAEAAQRKSEERYRALFNLVDQGFALMEVLRDENGAPDNLLFVEANPAFERLLALPNPVGRTSRELIPHLEDSCLQAYGRVAETGESVRFESHSQEYDRWLDIFASRVGAEGSNLVSVLFDDITERKRSEAALRESEERQAYLLKLSDALRPLTDPVEIQETASRMLGEQIGADRSLYAEIDEPSGEMLIARHYARDGVPSIIGRYPMGLMPWMSAAARTGKPTAVDDVRTSPLIPDDARATMKIGAFIATPLIKNDRLVAALCVSSPTPRKWRETEALLVQETADRTWAAVERARAEAAKRVSEERYGTLFDSIDQGIAVVEVLYDEEGEARDLRFLEANRVWEQQNRVRNPVGRTSSEVLPFLELSCVQRYGRVAETGEAVRFECDLPEIGLCLEIHAARVGGPGSRVVSIVFNDITERKRAEAVLRASEERQAYLLKLSDALRPLTDPLEIQATASRLLGEELNADRAFYADVDEDRGYMLIEHEFARNGAARKARRYPLSEFEWVRKTSRLGPNVVNDVRTTPLIPDAERAAVLADGSGSFIAIPLIKNDRHIGGLTVADAEPRMWTAEEVKLVQETAERTWAAVGRARAEAALRESEEKYRTLFDSIDQGYMVIEILDDENGRPTDFRLVEANRLFEKQTGLTNCIGKKRRELFPVTPEDPWLQTYIQVMKTGTSLRHEDYSPGLRRWYSIFASRVGGEGSRLVNVVFDDITERKREEAARRESEQRKAYLLRLSDALGPLVSPLEIQATASRLLAEELKTDRTFYAEIDDDGKSGHLLIAQDHIRGNAPSVSGNYPIELCSWIRPTTGSGRPTVVNDVRTTTEIPDAADRAAVSERRVGAFVAVPLIKNGRLVAALCVTDVAPRDWTDAEVALVQETAERTWAAVQRAQVEAALSASEEKFRTLFDWIDQGYAVLEVVYDADGVANDLRFVDTNRVFEKQTGLKHHIGKTARELNPDLEQRWVDAYASVIESGLPVRFESYVKEIGRWLSIYAARVGGEGSRFVNVVFDDITERWQAQDALRRTEEKQAYKLKLSEALRPLSDTAEIQQTAIRLLGERLQTQRIFYAEIDEERNQFVIERDIVREGVRSIAGRYPLTDYPWIVSAGSAGRPVSVNDIRTSPLIPQAYRAEIAAARVGAFIGVPLIKDGRLVATLAVTSDSPRVWTEDEIELAWHTGERTWAAVVRERAEKALRENEERFRLFLDNVREYALVQCDTNLRFTSWNRGAERIFGYSSEEVLGKPFSLLLSPEDREKGVPCMKISDMEKMGRHEDARWLVHKDGHRIWTRWVSEPIRNKDGKITGLAKVLRDETERLKTETSLRQSEKLAVVGRMASSIAHEINNPLEAVTNLIYLARRGEVSPEVGEFLEQAEHELARVSHVTTATLHFHRQTTEPHEVDLEEILESVLVLHEGRLKSMQVATERRYGWHPSIFCQGNEIRQVLANLVSNALDAMARNSDGRRLIVRLTGAADPRTGEEGVRVMIADSGTGIRESLRRRVFEPFFTTKSTTGTGLGLWLSAETVEKHKGSLKFRSRTEGKYRGTVFSVFLKSQ